MKNLKSVWEPFIRILNHVSRVAPQTRVPQASRLAFLFLVATLCIPTAVVTLLLRPFLEIRFWPIHGDRLGHLVLETDLLISRIRPQNPGTKFVCFFIGKPANSFYADLIRRELTIVPSVIGDAGYLAQRIFLKKVLREVPTDIRRTRETLAPSTKWVRDNFDRAQVDSLLQELGLDRDCNYVCMWVRDSAYGSQVMSGDSQYFADYRDASIRNYHSLCRALDSRGVKVIRMGRVGVIEGACDVPYTDYLSSKLNSAENDFLLTKYCTFAVCGDSGSTTIPLLYRKPILLTNVGSFVGAITSESIQILTMKRIEWAETGLPVTASEIKRYRIHEFNDTKQFEVLGIRHVENTESELEGAALDLLELVEKEEARLSPQLAGLQARFRERVRELVPEEPTFRAGNLWLENNPQFGE